jgi:hypothetical protein
MERSNSMNPVEQEGSAFVQATSVSAPRKRRTGSKLTEWQSFFLERLEYLLGVQHDNRAADEAQNSLVSKAVYSTYLDCQSQGVGDEALKRITASTAGTPSAN